MNPARAQVLWSIGRWLHLLGGGTTAAAGFAGVQATGASNLFYVAMALLGVVIVAQVFFSSRIEEKLVAQRTPEAVAFHTWSYLLAGVLVVLLGVGLTITVLKLP